MGFNSIEISLISVYVNFSMFKILVPVSNFKVCVVSSQHVLHVKKLELYKTTII